MVIKLLRKLFLASLFLSLVFAKLHHTSSFEFYQKEGRNKTLNPPFTRLLQHSNYHINQIGEDIDGEDYYGRSGHSLSLSTNGMLLAVGAYSAYGYTGHVTTYAFHTNSETWVQRGQKIVGESGDDRSGGSVSLSHDGMTMAIGASQNRNYYGHTRVFGWDVTSQLWIQIGQDLDGTVRNGFSGAALALSGDGRRLAIGTPGAKENTGHAKVFERSGDSWNQLGSTIHGDDIYSALGGSLALTDDGTRVIIGSPLEYENDINYVGSVSVFEYSDGDWNQLGQDLTGDGYYDKFGNSVDISGDGSRIIIGVPYDDKGESNQGSARVYEYDEVDGWLQIGTHIIGEAIGDALGTSVSMSQDGNRIVLGASAHDSGGDNAGSATVYQFVPESSDWVQAGRTIIGGEANGNSGRAVTISPDGKKVAVGVPLGSYYNGHTRVYKITEGTTEKTSVSPSDSSSNQPTTPPSVTASMSPTAAPSNERSSPPSNPPTVLPSLTTLNPTPTPTSATSSPSKETSLSPSVVPIPICEDSPLKMAFKNRTAKKCAWVGKQPLKRCKMPKVTSHCPFTCNSPASCTQDSTKSFMLNGKNEKTCKWVSRKPTKRCKKRRIRKTCRLSCKGT